MTPPGVISGAAVAWFYLRSDAANWDAGQVIDTLAGFMNVG